MAEIAKKNHQAFNSNPDEMTNSVIQDFFNCGIIKNSDDHGPAGLEFDEKT
ncbi:MAG: hypothetical protein HQL13_05905 [Candidatus Omnitrophica bacterium]|nr:hypothetical protein [Candidatus Omnitrophota bacterium]